MIQHDAESSPPNQGLLATVLCNPELRRKFDKMPADLKTIELTIDDGSGVTSQNWKAGEVESALYETIEVPSGVAEPIDIPEDESFVPARRIDTIGKASRDDADYRIVGQLGQGGMAVVFQAHQRAIDREVALKVLREDLAINRFSRERFLSEARVIGGLDHPNVIALHEVCIDDAGGLLYSMKRVDGTSWDKKVGGMSLVQNVATLLDVSDAIRYAHSRGLVHRDIKPENVMLGRFGEVLLADWGLALSFEEGDTTLHVGEAIGGTPAYMPPELAGGDQDRISPKSDIYLLGATLFQILTGNPPHHGKSLLACIHAAAHNEIRATDVEGELMDIAMKAMATDPDDRYSTVEDFIKAIEDHRQHDESARLVRVAWERMSQSCEEKRYDDFRVADALLAEALDMWPENERASQMRHRMQVEFAKTAVARGDLDLAISLYDLAGEGDSPQAKEVRELIEHREASQRRVSRYSALFMQSPQAGMLIDSATGHVVEANKMFGELLGYSQEEVVDRPIADLNLFVCPERRAELIQELRTNGILDDFEATLKHTDGSTIETLISSRIVHVDGNEMVVSTVRDISLRKQAESALERSRQRLRDLQQLAGLGTWSFDVASGVVTWSDEAFHLVGRRVEDGVPTKDEYIEMIHPDDRERLREAFRATVESGAAYELQVQQRGTGGQYRRVILRGQPIVDDKGQTIEVYGVVIPQKS